MQLQLCTRLKWRYIIQLQVRLAKRMMRERAREHPEYTSKEIVREMINDPSISDEAKKRLGMFINCMKNDG